MKKYDLILIAVVLLAAAIFLGKYIISNTGSNSLYVQVVIGQRVVDEFPLDTNMVKTYEIDEGYNILVIKDGMADVIEASCPDKICVNERAINKTGETITCLPNKTIIKVIGAGEEEVDF